MIGVIWKSRKNRYRLGNAQLKGNREIQSNYFSIAENDSQDLFLVLADGTVDSPSGRRAAVIAVRHCINVFNRGKLHSPNADNLADTAKSANTLIREEMYLGTRPHVSLTMALFTRSKIHCFNVGDNKIYFYNGCKEQEPIYSYDKLFFYGCYDVPPKKSIVGIYSKGIHTVTHPMERIDAVSKNKKSIFDKSQALIECAERKNLNNLLNATALLVEVVK